MRSKGLALPFLYNLHQTKGNLKDVSLCCKVHKPVNDTACSLRAILKKGQPLLAVVTKLRHASWLGWCSQGKSRKGTKNKKGKAENSQKRQTVEDGRKQHGRRSLGYNQSIREAALWAIINVT